MITRNFEWLSDTNVGIGDKVILRNGSQHEVTRIFNLRDHTGMDLTHYHLIELDNSSQAYNYDDEGKFTFGTSDVDIMQVNLEETENDE